MIAALQKAEKLVAFAKEQGAPLHEFALLLTAGEAFELVNWLLSPDGPQNLAREVLQYDADIARAEGNPFIVLTNFNLNGLEIRRSIEVLH